MTKFRCTKCNYTAELINNPGQCPYCGQYGISEEQSASEILEDIEKILQGKD